MKKQVLKNMAISPVVNTVISKVWRWTGLKFYSEIFLNKIIFVKLDRELVERTEFYKANTLANHLKNSIYQL